MHSCCEMFVNSRVQKSNPAYRRILKCVHCRIEFKQLFARHVFCDVCAPDGKFSKYIRKYGIGKLEFDRMMFDQNRQCAICAKPLDQARDTHVDHDHNTGRVRGLLCNVCNSRVAVLKNSHFVVHAQAYLNRENDYRLK